MYNLVFFPQGKVNGCVLTHVVIGMWDIQVVHLSMGNVSFSPSHVGTAHFSDSEYYTSNSSS